LNKVYLQHITSKRVLYLICLKISYKFRCLNAPYSGNSSLITQLLACNWVIREELPEDDALRHRRM